MNFTKLWQSSALALLLAVVLPAFGQSTTNVYMVTDFGDSQIRVFNVADNTCLNGSEASCLHPAYHAGSSPFRVAVSSNGRTGFIQNVNSGFLSVFDFTIGAEFDRILGIRGTEVKISADGTLVAAPHDNALAIINGVTLASRDVDLGPAGGGSLAVAGTRAFFVTNSGGISVLDMAGANPSVSTVAGTGTQGGAQNGQSDAVAATPDGSEVVALLPDPNGLAEVIANPAGQAPQVISSINPDFYPWGVFITRDPNAATTYAYITGADSNNQPIVQVYTLANGQLTPVGGHVPLPLGWPAHGTLSADSTHLYVADFGNTLAMVDVTNPSALHVTSTQVGVQIATVSSYAIQTQAPPTAPVVTGVSPQTVPNFTPGASTAISVSGTNFSASPAAWLRVGNLQPITNGAVTGGSLAATVPASAPAQIANLIVANPGTSVADEWQSGMLNGQFVITTPPTYTAPNQVLVTNFGVADFDMLGSSSGTGNLPTLGGLFNPGTIAVTPDASRAYVTSVSPFGVTVIDLVGVPATATQPAQPAPRLLSSVTFDPNGFSGQEYSVAVANAPLNGGNPAAYVWGAYSLNDGSNNFGFALFLVDANTANPAPTSVLTQLPSGVTVRNGRQISGAMTITPDGLWGYANVVLDGPNWPFLSPNGKLVVYNLTTGAVANTLDCSTLGVDGFQGSLQLSPDGNYLLMTHTNTDSNGNLQPSLGASIDVFNIAGANRTSPQLVGQIAATVAGVNPPALYDFRIPQNTPGTLVAYDQLQNVFASFNFQPPSSTNPTANFSQLGSLVVPAVAGVRDSYNLDVTPDGHFVYVPLTDEDDVAVIDDSNATSPVLMTKIATGLGAGGVRIRPGTPTPASSSPDTAVTVTPDSTTTISLTGATAGTTSVTTSNATTVPPPSAFQISGVPTYYEITTTSTFSTAQVCFTYDPATVPSPESSLRLAHYDSSIDPNTNQVIGWGDVTLPGYPNTTTHTICGQVSSFSPFVIGIANVDFEFSTLLSDVGALSPSVTPVGVMRSLRAKVLAARAAHTRGSNATAVNQLNAFISEVNSLSGTQVTASSASQLAGEAQTLINSLQ